MDEIADVEKYGGFYIGRYEATTPDGTDDTSTNTVGIPTCQKGKVVWTNTGYLNSKTSAEKMYTGDNSSVQSGLLTGRAWDTTCHWIEDSVSSLLDSRMYGNYSDSQEPANVSGAGKVQVAGFSEKWSVKNIYDLAGNVWEETYERNDSMYISRGGISANSGISYPILFRSEDFIDSPWDGVGFRVRLYIKVD